MCVEHLFLCGFDALCLAERGREGCAAPIEPFQGIPSVRDRRLNQLWDVIMYIAPKSNIPNSIPTHWTVGARYILTSGYVYSGRDVDILLTQMDALRPVYQPPSVRSAGFTMLRRVAQGITTTAN